ncbi:MAG: hypothetical protein A3E87_04250 [Gammaproteobacteria bacterium RIFCSPHIGHO2_12_FULL_35_23]|nr:MAG: hypothetical protein A3E87_04250 [Gammaproteobacteria bacterium RIFCSPHIGHO2_12_FULL_35_23]
MDIKRLLKYQKATVDENKYLGSVLADRGYDADETVKFIESMGTCAIILLKPSRKTPRVCDRYLYKEHYLIECFIERIKYFRRVFSQFNKLQGDSSLLFSLPQLSFD